jgi:peptidoglycan/xylan/chitin deacetylase (PgdA/CDA1 family)
MGTAHPTCLAEGAGGPPAVYPASSVSAVHRALRSILRTWDRRHVQIAAFAGVLLAVAFSSLPPFPGAPGRADDDPAPVATKKAIPVKRLTGPAKLPAPPVTDEETQAVLAAEERVGPIRHGGGARRLVALTFDDGPGPYTGRILAILRRTATPATFFQVGKNLEENPNPGQATALLDRVAIGDHTYTHHSLTAMTRDQQSDEIISTAATMEAQDEKPPRLFRPPYGAFNQDTQALMSERGMALILWSVDSQDYARPGVKRIVENVISAATPGAIVLMHDGGGDRSQTVKALPRIIKRLRARGYGLVTVPELLLRDPPRQEDQHVAAAPPGAGQGAG